MRTRWPAACPQRYYFGTLLLCALSTACNFDLPPASTFRSAPDEVLFDLPFHSRSVSALAWHPDGSRLAVVEDAGAQSLLTGIALANLQTRAYATLPLRAERNWQALPGRGWMIGENDDGQLVARLLEGSFVQTYFAGPIAPGLWSLSEDGEQLLYALRDQPGAIEIRLHHFATGQDFVLVDSLESVRGFKILPNASGFIVWQYLLPADSFSQRLHYFNLPARTVHKTFALNRTDALFSPAKDSSRLAFVREHASFNQADSLIILDLHTEKFIRFPLIDRPLSRLIWIDNNRLALWEWQRGFSGQEGERMSLRAYSVLTQASQLLAQRLTFGYYYSSEIFAVADNIFYLTPSPPRVCLFDRMTYSCKELLVLPTIQHRIEALAWIAQGEKLFVHARDETGSSNFYLLGPAQIQQYRKPYFVSSVSLLPDERHFIGIMNQHLFKDGIASSTPDALLPHLPCTAAAVHPSGEYVAAFGMPRGEPNDTSTQPLLLIDLHKNAVIDSLMLPGASANELQWLLSARDQNNFSALWRREPNASFYSEYYHIAFGLRLISPVYYDHWSSDFTIFPANDFLSVLSGDRLVLTEWRIETP